MTLDRSFTAPLDMLGLDPSKTIEIGVLTEQPPLRWELAETLGKVDGLDVQQYERKTLGVEQLILLVGTAASIIQALEVLRNWWFAARQRDHGIRVTIRTKHGEVELTAATWAEARRLFDQVKRVPGD